MVWQDILISLANIIFAYSLAYQVYIGFKEKKGALSIQTALLTFISLYVLSFAFITLNLFLSAIVSAFNGTMWALLLMQRLTYEKA
jgi:hypothetical protein